MKINEVTDWKPNRDIHLVRDKLDPHGYQWKGRTDDDANKAYGVLGTRRPTTYHRKGEEHMKDYYKHIAGKKDFNVHFHDE